MPMMSPGAQPANQTDAKQADNKKHKNDNNKNNKNNKRPLPGGAWRSPVPVFLFDARNNDTLPCL